MGHRTLKRVPLNFQAPLHKVWKGYINPYPGPLTCNLCDGSGHNAATKKIADEFYDSDGFGVRWAYNYNVGPDGLPATRPPWQVIGQCRRWCNNITQDEVQALVDGGRLISFTHTWTQGEGWKRREDGYIPTAEEVNAAESRGGLDGHDAWNRWILIEARAKRLGVYGTCPRCKGKGEKFPPRIHRRPYKAWRECEPPTGDGFQLWETCSEGSPISPVFASADKLADWCAENATIFADEKISHEDWFKMFVGEDDLEAGSLLIVGNGYFGSLANAPK